MPEEHCEICGNPVFIDENNHLINGFVWEALPSGTLYYFCSNTHFQVFRNNSSGFIGISANKNIEVNKPLKEL